MGGHQGLDALDGPLMDLVAGEVLQVQVDLFDVGPEMGRLRYVLHCL